MIYYFSGTGNSKYVADILSNILDSHKNFIPETNPLNEDFYDETLGFVFPVYAWGVPPVVLNFIAQLSDGFWNSVKIKQAYIWIVMTCGDETAMAPEILIKNLNKKGIIPDSVWSVIMPNNYVLLPGFDVDPVNVEESKLNAVKGRLLEISSGILENRKGIDVTRGKLKYLKSKLVYPLFIKWGINTKKWHFLPSCVGCEKCARVCPMQNIKMNNGHPFWGARCCSCLACYHICPYHSVAYSKETLKKGQYFFPLKKLCK